MKRGCLIAFIGFCAVFIVIGIIANIGGDSEPTKPSYSSTPPPAAIPPTAPTPVDKGPDKALVKLAHAILLENFGSMCDVEVNLEENCFILIPTDKDLIFSIVSASAGEKSAVQLWNGLVESMAEMSESMCKVLPEFGIMIANPLAHDKVILAVYDGIVVYNFIDD